MAKKRVTEALWAAIAPLLPEHKPSPKGGRPPVPDRACLEGIIFVLKTGMAWQMLPTRLGYGSGSTCWRRFHAWTQLGVWPELHRRLLRVLGRRGRINLERAVIDSASVRALKGGAHRPEPHGSRQEGLQTPHRDRCGRHPAGGPHRAGQPAGRGDGVGDARCHPALRRPQRPSATTAQDVPRRRGVRDQGGHRRGRAAARSLPVGPLRQGAHEARQRPGQDALRRRAVAQLDEQLPPAEVLL